MLPPTSASSTHESSFRRTSGRTSLACPSATRLETPVRRRLRSETEQVQQRADDDTVDLQRLTAPAPHQVDVVASSVGRYAVAVLEASPTHGPVGAGWG